jgi:hypothetical protein
MKKTIISSCICLVIGIIIGILIDIYGYYYPNKTNKLESGINVNILDGKPGTIEHEKIKNYHKHIEIVTKSKGNGKIKTTIKKESFCPKVHKNSLSAVVYAGIDGVQPVISYGLEYRRNVFSRFHVLTGAKVDTGLSKIKGFQIFIGVGVNF